MSPLYNALTANSTVVLLDEMPVFNTKYCRTDFENSVKRPVFRRQKQSFRPVFLVHCKQDVKKIHFYKIND